MSEQTGVREPRVSGEEILSELLRNLEDGLFPIRFTILVPSVFRIYLNQSDYDPLQGAIPFLTTELKQALTQQLAEWNRSGRVASVLAKLGASAKQRREYKLLGDDWTLEFYPDAEGRLGRGEIEIYSELGVPARTEYGSGALTQRITRREAGGQLSSHEVQLSPTVQMPAPKVGDEGDDSATVRASEPTYATLNYEDQSGRQTFAIRKNQIVVGRGGKAYWVDVKLVTAPDVSREHFRLRRDPVSGQFYLKDVSQFGTSIDGVAVPTSIERVDGQERDQNVEVPLPNRARIGLADCLFLDFEIGPPKDKP